MHKGFRQKFELTVDVDMMSHYHPIQTALISLHHCEELDSALMQRAL
jgi:hypothetical protein